MDLILLKMVDHSVPYKPYISLHCITMRVVRSYCHLVHVSVTFVHNLLHIWGQNVYAILKCSASN